MPTLTACRPNLPGPADADDPRVRDMRRTALRVELRFYYGSERPALADLCYIYRFDTASGSNLSAHVAYESARMWLSAYALGFDSGRAGA